MSGELQVDYATFRRMEFTDPRFGLRMLAAWIFALILLGSGVWHVLTEPISVQHAYLFLFALGLAAIPDALIGLSWLTQRKRYAVPARYQITAQGAAEHTAAGTRQVAWSEVARVNRGRHAWTIKKAFGAEAFVIPRAAFTPAASKTINDFFLAHPEFAG
ncbi:hypothetical protein ACWT_5603 [Actinoplanes sp. SE50]|uniref:YcxB family protein n=1 Tax=unclassified Actinoplanes TaxID=2626549 RepID=UPI00023ECF22|nr:MULTISPECIES: YcxB family protein [unclassified Actinoplanes]AEV86620.1 hypothetical protein ACPL_5733 [Actinoplanes sp. SE50/110]ATO85018.1 hypothetical protein ACWT_5603 [Actinoplanes sp. SE50]SLM02428.1 hypothetical protein ACSP50_5677 [Actinoplanes sp. SE50/110]